jgi:crotonobetainyl-CoA:carnitine CoA-transferase CaiB-like acyl-CoA transferase
MQQGLAGIRVVDFSEQIAGPYCSKLLVDGGAEVVKVEPPGGDSLRRGSATDADLCGRDSALFRFLNAGKQSVVGAAADSHVEALLAEADLVIEAHGLESDTGQRLDVARLRTAHPSLVVLSITPYGLTGPWANRRATEFTLQAESGSLGMRGVMGKEPFQAGGRIGEWAAGTYGAVAALPAVFRAHSTGQGEHIDLSVLETANMVFTNFSEAMNRLMNGSPEAPEHAFLAPTVETPSIEPTSDGYVGFCTNSRQQFSDFLLLIERPELREDEQLAQFAGRLMRFDEWNEIMRAWLKEKTTAEAIELASLLRIPVAPICNGKTVLRWLRSATERPCKPTSSWWRAASSGPMRMADSSSPGGPIGSMMPIRRLRAPLRAWARTRAPPLSPREPTSGTCPKGPTGSLSRVCGSST